MKSNETEVTFDEKNPASEMLAALGHPFAAMYREAIGWFNRQAFPRLPGTRYWLLAGSGETWFAACGPRLNVLRPGRSRILVPEAEWPGLAARKWAGCQPRFNVTLVVHPGTLVFHPGGPDWLLDTARQLADGDRVRLEASGHNKGEWALYCADWIKARAIISTLASGFPVERNQVGRVERMQRADAEQRRKLLDEVNHLGTGLEAPDAWL